MVRGLNEKHFVSANTLRKKKRATAENDELSRCLLPISLSVLTQDSAAACRCAHARPQLSVCFMCAFKAAVLDKSTGADPETLFPTVLID